VSPINVTVKFDLSFRIFPGFLISNNFLDFILSFSSMTGEQAAQPSSPRDGEDISITAGLPKVV